MKKLIIATMGTALLLTGCGTGEGTTLGKIDEKNFTSGNYIEMLHEEVPSILRQENFINEIAINLAEEGKVKEVNDRTLEQMKEMNVGELTKEDKEDIEKSSKINVGLVKLFKDTKIITDKDIEEDYKENKEVVTLNTVVLYDEHIGYKDEVKKILKDGKNVKDKIKKLDGDIILENEVSYNAYTLPYELMKAMETEKGKVFETDLDGTKIISRVVDKEEAPLEELEHIIAVNLGFENIDTVGSLILKAEDEGVIELGDRLKDYLEIDEDKSETKDGKEEEK